jgi:hypothetical protein
MTKWYWTKRVPTEKPAYNPAEVEANIFPLFQYVSYGRRSEMTRSYVLSKKTILARGVDLGMERLERSSSGILPHPLSAYPSKVLCQHQWAMSPGKKEEKRVKR